MSPIIEKAQKLRDLGKWCWTDIKAYEDHPHVIHLQDMQDHLNSLEQAIREARQALAQFKQEVSA